MMSKSLHPSWIELATRGADCALGIVRFDFGGVLSEGSHAGTAFAGRIEYNLSTQPTERHCAFAIYDRWSAPIVTVAIGGQMMMAEGAAVYEGVDDGAGGRHDFVTMFGKGPADGRDGAAHFELLFANEQAALDSVAMPSAARLQGMPIKQLSFGTNAPRNVISRGDFTLRVPRSIGAP